MFSSILKYSETTHLERTQLFSSRALDKGKNIQYPEQLHQSQSFGGALSLCPEHKAISVQVHVPSCQSARFCKDHGVRAADGQRMGGIEHWAETDICWKKWFVANDQPLILFNMCVYTYLYIFLFFFLPMCMSICADLLLATLMRVQNHAAGW